MSRAILKDKFWKTKDVLPYLYSFFNYHKGIKMYIVGSRGKTKIEDWDDILKGKDWDVLIQTNKDVFMPNNLVHKKYHVDILWMGNEEKLEKYRNIGYNGCKGGFELFPNIPDELKKFLVIK